MSDSTQSRRILLLAGAVLWAISVPALAQQTGGMGGATGMGGGTTGFGGGGTTGIGGGGGGTAGSGAAGGRAGAGAAAGGTAGGNAFGGSVGFTGTGAELTTGPSSAVQTSNIFSGYFANPYAIVSGTLATSGVERANAPFGQPLYTATSTANRGAAAQRGTATIAGGRARVGGAGVAGTTGRQGDFTIPGNMGTRYPHIATVVAFKSPAPAADRLLSDVRATIDRSSSISSKAGISITAEGRNIILRGRVASDEERRHVEALLRLTPGLGEIRNELIAPDG